MWYVYLIQCNDGGFYTGVNSNLERRFNEHKTGSGSFHTKLHKPIKILYTEEYHNKLEAIKREKK